MSDRSGLGSVVTPLVLRIIGGVIIVAWVASIVADALVPTYEPPQTIGLAFMAVVSAVLGAAAVRQGDRGQPESVKPDEKDGGK
jgi:membrane protein implicated in regulation of membrane protease activity